MVSPRRFDKSRPPKENSASCISTGNFEDDMSKINSCDWIIEVVIENLDIKKKVFESVEKYRDRALSWGLVRMAPRDCHDRAQKKDRPEDGPFR